jgi:cell division protein FtsL
MLPWAAFYVQRPKICYTIKTNIEKVLLYGWTLIEPCLEGVEILADQDEIQEIKQSLHKLEEQVSQLKNASRRQRSPFSRFAIGFFIVFFVMLLAVGVIQFVNQ